MKRIVSFFIVTVLAACSGSDKKNLPTDDNTDADSSRQAPVSNTVQVIKALPHDTASFTEGLQIYDGKLYEGSGDYENSALQIADLQTGKVLQKHKMGSKEIFGEGINVFKGKIYQLTWQSHIVYVYDEKNINAPIKTFSWPYEGWGMTNDGTNLIISDGKPNGHLYFVSPDSFKIVKTLTVTDNNGPKKDLNELEYINGFIYANIWNTNTIVKIDPTTGNILLVINCANLLEQYAFKELNDPDFDKEGNVLNGIAYDPATKKTYITGKRWPKLFEVVLN
ncbi:MAG: glutaminyl-peptide cyclotransferase [Ferruginibacter sp.]